jgi:serine/threonine protein kinase
MAREIIVLRRLDHPNVIKLEGVITSRMSSSLYLVFEYMEHDLAGLASSPGVHLSEPQVNTLKETTDVWLSLKHTWEVLQIMEQSFYNISCVEIFFSRSPIMHVCETYIV